MIIGVPYKNEEKVGPLSTIEMKNQQNTVTNGDNKVSIGEKRLQ